MRLTGALLLILGWLAAFIVYWMAERHAAADAGQAAAVAAAFDSNEREMQQVERLGGAAAVLTLKFHRWLASLWHGERLAYTLAALATAAALLCRHIAALMAEEVAERPLAPRRK